MNNKCVNLGNKKSIIRELFEFSKQQKKLLGPDKVFDFTIGNPSIPPHKIVDKTLKELLSLEDTTVLHGYTSTQGDFETRKAVADDLNKRYQTSYDADDIYMTVGAASSLCVCFRAIVENPADEIIALAPFFTEYRVFVEGANAKLVVSLPSSNFEIDFTDLDKRINKNTKAIIINSPNNPTGVIYSKECIEKLADLLRRKEKEYNTIIYIVSDEPYREIAYEKQVPHIPDFYRDTLICYSYSKSLSLPGERIGYVLVPKANIDNRLLYAAIIGAGREYGYVCAPSLFQKMIARCASYTSDISIYKKNRDLIYNGLTKIGYDCVYPQGAFYLFVKALEDDANKFVKRAQKYNLILVPSDDFGITGYVRIAYCVKSETIINSLSAFKVLFDEYKGGK